MCQSESLSWQKTGKTYNGLRDFGLLRDKPDPLDRKPKLFSIYFSRTVFVVGILAGFTFVVCLILADKYQKTSKTPHLHHYASSYIYEKEREKLLLDKNRRQETRKNDDNLVSIMQKIQNISKNIRIDEINRLMPMTTVLHSVSDASTGRNTDKKDVAAAMGSDRTVRKIDEKRTKEGRRSSDSNETDKNVDVIRSKNSGLNLADLLKRAEAKYHLDGTKIVESSTATTTTTTTELNGVQFAQLEGYEHYFRDENNVIELLKFVNCQTAAECGQKFNSDENAETEEDESVERLTDWEQDDTPDTDRDYTNVSSREIFSSNNDSASIEPSQPIQKSNDLLYADTNLPVYYSPYFSGKHRINAFDPFRNFRVSDPIEINNLEQQSDTVSEQLPINTGTHRFSNRMYQSNEGFHEPRLYTAALEPYLRPPPTPPPVGLSFTPSYTTAIFHGYDDSATTHQQSDELKSEESVVQPVMQVKPISLMVEIFPANDYQLPGYIFGENQRQQFQPKRQQEQTFGDSNQQINDPSSWLPWKLSSSSSNSQNRMKLHVNLFPQRDQAARHP